MPWQSRFKTKAGQQRAITLAMCLVFIVMLTGAVLYSTMAGWQHFDFHHARIHLHSDWQVKEENKFRIVLERADFGRIEIRRHELLKPTSKDDYFFGQWRPTKDMKKPLVADELFVSTEQFGKHKKVYGIRHIFHSVILLVGTEGLAKEYVILQCDLDDTLTKAQREIVRRDLIRTFQSLEYTPPSP